MKIAPRSDILAVEEAGAAQPAAKVCMHILNTAKSDIRATRAATALLEAGYAVSIVDVQGEGAQLVEKDISGIYKKHIIVPWAFKTTRFERWALLRAAWMLILGILQLIRIPADIYHALDLPALPACFIAAQLRHKPLIFESYELPLAMRSTSEMSTSRRWLDALIAPLLTVMLPRCAGIITVSPPIADEFRQRYHCPNVALIRNIPAYRAVPKSDSLRQHLGLNPNTRIALYQGYLQPDRGLDRLIHAAAFLERDITIVMMGKGEGSTQSQLEALITREGVADLVKILPPVPYAELLNWTASADLGLIIYMPDYSLNVRMMLPNKLFEYLMAGLPILASPLEAVEEIIRAYDIGQVVSSLAPEDIGSAINAMLANTEVLARMRHNALEAARYEFHWEKESSHLIRLYDEIQSRTLVKMRNLKVR
jgi:glycosyltransferase involved in cell wall biosynthesis